MEHLHHFNLSDDPFRNEPLFRFYFDTEQQQAVLLRMDRAVRQAKGLIVLIGDVGSGKTMAVRQLLENLEEEVFEVGMMVVLNGAADALWMLTRFAKQLGVEEPPPEREALIAEIYDRLAIVREDGRHAVLIIDDAQALASPETLSEICGLLKLEYEERRLLSLVLAGTRGLADAIARDPILSHRVDVRVELGPLDADTAQRYLLHRIAQAGGDPSILDRGCIDALHRCGCGVPGLMNTLADNALFEAFLCGRTVVTATDVERAHSDLGWSAAAPAAPPEAVAPKRPAAPGPVAQALPASPAVASAVRNAPAREIVTAVDVAVPAMAMGDGPPEALLRASLRGSLGDIDSELEAVFDPDEMMVSTEAPIDPTSPEAIGSFVTPIEGPPKDDADVPEDLLVELIED